MWEHRSRVRPCRSIRAAYPRNVGAERVSSDTSPAEPGASKSVSRSKRLGGHRRESIAGGEFDVVHIPISEVCHEQVAIRCLSHTEWCLDVRPAADFGGARDRAIAGLRFDADHVRYCQMLWIGRSTTFIEPGSPWENGYVESFNGKLRDELLNGEIFYTLREAQVIVERWRREYNTFRPHSSLAYRPPAPETVQWPWPRDEEFLLGLT